MAHRLDQQVAIVTGASRGIGRAIAEAYAAEGASLCLIATDTARLKEVKDSLGLPAERIIGTARPRSGGAKHKAGKRAFCRKKIAQPARI